MTWILLTLAGLLEVVWSLGLKYTQGFTRLGPSLVTLVALAGSTLLLAQVSRTLPIGTAYAVWVAIGVVGAAIGGVFLFGEQMSVARAAFLVLLVISIVGLKVTTRY